MRISDWSSDVCSSDLLDIAGRGAALVAEAVLMGDRTLADIGDDFHVAVTVHRKAGMRLDLVVVPHPQGTEAVAHRGGDAGEAEVEPAVQPVDMHASEIVERDEDRKSPRLNSSH